MTIPTTVYARIPLFQHPPLQRSSQNWCDWCLHIHNILHSHDGIAYIEGMEYKPSESEHCVFTNWKSNHLMICGFIMGAIDIKEIKDFDHLTSTSKLWTMLVAIYDRKGVALKVDTLFKLLSSPYSWDSPNNMTTQFWSMMDRLKKLYVGGLPSLDEMSLYMFLWNLDNSSTANEFAHIQSLITTNPSISYTEVFTYMLSCEQSRTQPRRSTSDNALVSNNNHTSNNHNNNNDSMDPKSYKGCIICDNCSKAGHEKKFCVSVGGGMAGKSIFDSLVAQGKKP